MIIFSGMPKLLFRRVARRPPATAAAAAIPAANVAAVAASFMFALTTTATGNLPAAAAAANSSNATPRTPASSSVHKYLDVHADATFGSVTTSSSSGYEHFSTTVHEIQDNLLPWASRYIACGYESLSCDHAYFIWYVSERLPRLLCETTKGFGSSQLASMWQDPTIL